MCVLHTDCRYPRVRVRYRIFAGRWCCVCGASCLRVTDSLPGEETTGGPTVPIDYNIRQAKALEGVTTFDTVSLVLAARRVILTLGTLEAPHASQLLTNCLKAFDEVSDK